MLHFSVKSILLILVLVNLVLTNAVVLFFNEPVEQPAETANDGDSAIYRLKRFSHLMPNHYDILRKHGGLVFMKRNMPAHEFEKYGY
uniref:Uncharacterized protein n=1 Tax=Acrobeloides nanus TaxID=290746 RepID=A0A914D409_9BILA